MLIGEDVWLGQLGKPAVELMRNNITKVTELTNKLAAGGLMSRISSGVSENGVNRIIRLVNKLAGEADEENQQQS